MNTYSVKQIADMLETNPETVRRWIRTGKLQAVQESRKSGNVVTEQMLQAFLKESPKYAGVAAALLVTPIGITATAATLLGGLITHQYTKNEKVKNAQVKVEDVERLLKSDVASRRASIKRKQEAIHQLEQEIEDELQHIAEAKKLIADLSLTENSGKFEKEELGDE